MQYFYASPDPQKSVAVNDVQSYVWHIILAILVLLCCDPILGLVALILAGRMHALECDYLVYRPVGLYRPHTTQQLYNLTPRLTLTLILTLNHNLSVFLDINYARVTVTKDIANDVKL